MFSKKLLARSKETLFQKQVPGGVLSGSLNRRAPANDHPKPRVCVSLLKNSVSLSLLQNVYWGSDHVAMIGHAT